MSGKKDVFDYVNQIRHLLCVRQIFKNFIHKKSHKIKKEGDSITSIVMSPPFLNESYSRYPSWNFLEERISRDSVIAIDSDS